MSLFTGCVFSILHNIQDHACYTTTKQYAWMSFDIFTMEKGIYLVLFIVLFHILHARVQCSFLEEQEIHNPIDAPSLFFFFFWRILLLYFKLIYYTPTC